MLRPGVLPRSPSSLPEADLSSRPGHVESVFLMIVVHEVVKTLSQGVQSQGVMELAGDLRAVCLEFLKLCSLRSWE